MTIQEFEARIKEIHAHDGTKLMCLQEAQVNFGYLSQEVMTLIAKEFGVTTSEIYSIASFYAQFTFVKKGKYVINVCLGTACYVRGSAEILARFEQLLGIKLGETTPDGIFSLSSARCVGCCGLAPVIMVNDRVFSSLTPDKCEGIIHEYMDLEKEGANQ